MPAVEDSAAPHAAEEGPMVGVPPSGSLPPFRVVYMYDYSGDLRVSDLTPQSGVAYPVLSVSDKCSLQIHFFFP